MTAAKFDRIRIHWRLSCRLAEARRKIAASGATIANAISILLATCLLLTSGTSLYAAPQTPFSTDDTSPVFNEPSFGQAPVSEARFSQSLEENISFELPGSTHSVSLQADKIEHWVENDFEVLHLRGNVKIKQASLSASSGEAIVWIEIPNNDIVATETTKPHEILVYLEQDVAVELANRSNSNQTTDRIKDQAWFGRLQTTGTVELGRFSEKLTASPPTLFNRAKRARDQNQANPIQQASFLQSFPLAPQNGSLTSDGQVWIEDNQFASRNGVAQRPQLVVNPVTGQATTVPPNGYQTPQPTTPSFGPSTPAQAGGQLSQGGSPYKILLSRRDPSFSLNLKNFINPSNPNEKVTLLTGGIRLAMETPSISDLRAFQGDADRKLYLTADNAVQWQLTLPDGTRRNQFYLEGDVIFAKGTRIINAQRMFYDVESQRGTILKADMRTNVSGINGPVRVKADVIQQLGENDIQAFGTAVTTSRLGVPRYWLQSESLSLRQSPVFDPAAGVAEANLSDGLSNFQNDAPNTDFTMDGQGNRIYVGGVPVFAWPRIRTTLSSPTLYLDSFNINSDNNFGTQVRTGWNMHQVLGLQPTAGVEWIGNVDYLSERGWAIGSEVKYQRDGLFGIPGRVAGRYDSWYIDDDGTDNLGRGRTALIPEEDLRGRTVFQHRHDFGPGYQLRAELGYISDRNFLEQFYEREWDTNKDATTGFWLERNVGTNSYNLTGDLQLNDFFTQTSGIEYNQFKLGQPIFNNRGVWHASAHAGYQRLRQATTPTDATDAATFDPLAWEADVDGFTAGTRQEIDFPMQIGPVKVVPYLMGDVSYWQEGRDGEDLVRAIGQTGVRASLPIWRVDPSIKSILWNVDGLAHKVSFDVDAFFAEATQDLDELALYDPLDDDAQEHFRRRFAFDTFNILSGGDTPLRFDERYFALRSGMQSNVTAASSEIADDLFSVKLGVRQKWQTKRGLPGQQRIIDWITLDTQATLFPKADRDNFNSDFGMFDYDFRWYLGDRLSLVSDGYFDFFSQGLRTASFGANISRPGNGNAYVGFRTIEGPISSNILSASMSYRMSDKWGLKAGGQIDFGDTGTIGQTLSLIYIGESFLWQFGFNFDHSRDNFGFRFGFEPRFTKNPQLFRPGGEAIQPAGSKWLE